MELYNMLVRPDEDFELVWHRDDIAASASKCNPILILNSSLAWGANEMVQPQKKSSNA